MATEQVKTQLILKASEAEAAATKLQQNVELNAQLVAQLESCQVELNSRKEKEQGLDKTMRQKQDELERTVAELRRQAEEETKAGQLQHQKELEETKAKYQQEVAAL